MMAPFQLAWVTDSHFDFLPPEAAKDFGESIQSEFHPDALVLTGDIATGNTFQIALQYLAEGFQKPIYFVLGNHDFYGSSFETVNKAAASISNPNLFYLNQSGVISLTKDVALVGHQGWYDARFGRKENSRVVMSDFVLIKDFIGKDIKKIVEVARTFADRAAGEARQSLLEAVKNFPKVYFATHFPPFREAAWHQGQLCHDEFMPWMASKVMGKMILELANNYPKCQMTVLCGHTHSEGKAQVTHNLEVLTAKARYRSPEVFQVLAI